MHATPIRDAVGDNLCILKHRGSPNRYEAVKGIQVVQNTMARHIWNCARWQAP